MFLQTYETENQLLFLRRIFWISLQKRALTMLPNYRLLKCYHQSNCVYYVGSSYISQRRTKTYHHCASQMPTSLQSKMTMVPSHPPATSDIERPGAFKGNSHRYQKLVTEESCHNIIKISTEKLATGRRQAGKKASLSWIWGQCGLSLVHRRRSTNKYIYTS